MEVWKLISVLLFLALRVRENLSEDLLGQEYLQEYSGQSCVNTEGDPMMCSPQFSNVAYGEAIEATNTCGMPPYGRTEYCVQTAAGGKPRECNVCDDNDPYRRHPASYLTDFNNNEDETWWQSETMYENLEKVNLTLKLPKAFEITYIRLKFHSPRPESFAIYKKTNEEGKWIPYQFYSATCRDSYGRADVQYIRLGGDEMQAMCTSEFSDISPLTGGNVAFATLEGRPSRYDFENSKELQEWVTATEIRITLDRMNTFGDEVFESPAVLKSYYYAISDIAVGGRCKCNGHASECVTTGDPYDRRWYCLCDHNTAGPDCNECQPLFNDRPWMRATSKDAHECKACQCNNLADKCFFDAELYNKTGHGGHCLDCKRNRDGANCERCKPNFYGGPDQWCYACGCDPIGSRSMQCNSEGKCQCKPGVTGLKCDRCEANYYDFGPQGCKACECSVPGSLNNQPDCDPYTGICNCKENVEGQRCDKCKPGYFHLDTENEFGCTPCFCFGRSSVCSSAQGYGQVLLESIFARGKERWTAEDPSTGSISEPAYNAITQNIGVSAPGRDPVYFVAPDRFLGDQRGSYNQVLNFSLRIGDTSARAGPEDIIIEGGGRRISQPIFGSGNALPTLRANIFSYRLHESTQFGWNPRLSPQDFISVLSNLTAIKIRGTYNPGGVGFLDDVTIKTARRGAAGAPAPWVESCTCPDGYIGQFCESCAPNYTREKKNGGPVSRCVPCTCNGHADMCDPESGQCICRDDTAGENCERCARGFYGNSLAGTSSDCQPCPCPNKGACMQMADSTIVCLECPSGYAGPLCEFCGDGYFGDPSGLIGDKTECQNCDCNENIDPNAVGNCNRTTGECLKCIYNTGGPRCDHCLPGYFGDALSPDKGDCRHCQCNILGTIPTPENTFVCEQPLGQCPCKDNVVGRQCDACEEGYYDLSSGEGCKACECDPIGSLDGTCDTFSGQCRCRPGVTGQKCDMCVPYYYGFSTEGCKPCECDGIGSTSPQCSPDGQCPCHPNVEGRACERCKENTQNRQRGCESCPTCYNLIQEAVNKHRDDLNEMEATLQTIANAPTVIDDKEFGSKLKEVQDRVDQLWNDAKSATGGDGTNILDQIKELKEKVKQMDETAEQTRASLDKTEGVAEEINNNMTISEAAIVRADDAIKAAQRFVDGEGTDALDKAREQALTFGEKSQELSDLAREARALADKHEDDAGKIEETAQKALNISTRAHDTARDAAINIRSAADEARGLLSTVQQLEDELKATEVRATESLKQAQEAYNNALTQYTQASSLTLPDIDLDAIQDQAQQAKADAERVKELTQQLVEARKEALEAAKETAEKAQEIVEVAKEEQQRADELVTDLHAVKTAAEDVRNKSETAYREAEKVFETLEGFNQNIDENKQRADEAKEQVEGIAEDVQAIVVETVVNRQNLAEAEALTRRALRDAESAMQQAEKTSEDAGTIKEETGMVKDKAAALQTGMSDLTTKIADASVRLTNAEQAVLENDDQVQTSLQKASEARANTNDAHEKIQKALDDVRDISLALENLEDINRDGLEEMEAKIREVEESVRLSGIDEKLEALRMSRNKQTQWVKQYEDELEMLKADVGNIRDIRKELPPDSKCYRRNANEP